MRKVCRRELDDATMAAVRELRTIPGVGEATSGDLIRLGVRSIDELAKRDPRELYEDLCDIQQMRLDPCVLYVFRCAVYYASTDEPEPELTKWWNWKDREWPQAAESD